MILVQLTDSDAYSLQRWIADNAPEAVTAGLSVKDIVDLATWVLHGTHTLGHYPREIQEARISETARTFRLAPNSLASLYRHASDLIPVAHA